MITSSPRQYRRPATYPKLRGPTYFEIKAQCWIEIRATLSSADGDCSLSRDNRCKRSGKSGAGGRRPKITETNIEAHSASLVPIKTHAARREEGNKCEIRNGEANLRIGKPQTQFGNNAPRRGEAEQKVVPTLSYITATTLKSK